ncbi:radical SAM protein [Micromonospora sp. NPDC049559]|uniref:radical SAM protein n=1 Tax=Micromonospora sp. NPDC049559 TaxID=3155923 RepID=UPI003433C5C4
MVDVPDRPENIVWDITYACPLRCLHCYSESGRRPSRQLSAEDLVRVVDAMVALRPRSISLAGGEPLLVPGVFDLAERIAGAGIGVLLYTGGWSLPPETAERAVRVFHRIVVSVDGATAETHDRIRGRVGSFARALTALERLDRAARGGTHRRRPAQFGVEYAVLRDNLGQLAEFCAEIAPRFPAMSFLAFGAAVPSGLASRTGVAEQELLGEDQLDLLTSAAHTRYLQSLAPASVHVSTTDNRVLQMRPDLIARGEFAALMQVEPDGAVRAMPSYEGTVGNLRTEPGELLWKRAVARWHDPFVREALAGVRTMAEWAGATRRIDYHFGTPEVRARIDRRPEPQSSPNRR